MKTLLKILRIILKTFIAGTIMVTAGAVLGTDFPWIVYLFLALLIGLTDKE